MGVLTSSIGVRVRRFFGFILGGGLSGRVSSEVSADVQLVVYGPVCADFLNSFRGATNFFHNVVMQNIYCVFAAALLHKVDRLMLSIPKTRSSPCNKRFPILFPSIT